MKNVKKLFSRDKQGNRSWNTAIPNGLNNCGNYVHRSGSATGTFVLGYDDSVDR
jgi:hypothetical protein